jgi:anaerobic selenocysteine-containing dehydrogenase
LNDAAYIRDVIKKIPFVVSFSTFMDETAKQADIILPGSMYLEMIQDLPSGSGSVRQVVGLSKPVLEPLFDTRNPGDIIIDLAKSLESPVADNFEWDDYDACLEETASRIWKALSRKGHVVVTDKAPVEMPLVDFSFLVSDSGTTQLPGDAGAYPLILFAIDHVGLIGNVPASSPFAVKTISDTIIKGKDGFVEINPETADTLRLKQGDRVQITTPKGSAFARVNRFDGMMPGYIGMVRGLGHTVGNQFISMKGVNVNELITPVIEAGSGLDAAYGAFAKISKA